MPVKKCQNCQEENHVRKLACTKCGTLFPTKIKKEKSVEKIDDSITVGNWHKEKTKGMPEIVIPEPLDDGKLSVEQIRDYVSYEGIGYCILTYISPDKIIDDKLREMWTDTKQQLKEVISYIYDK